MAWQEFCHCMSLKRTLRVRVCNYDELTVFGRMKSVSLSHRIPSTHTEALVHLRKVETTLFVLVYSDIFVK